MSHKRPRLTQGAKELLESHQQTIRNRIHNIAEKRAIDEGRNEINETDILQAQRSITITTTSTSRKWGIRILISLTFIFLVAQIGAFYQLFQLIGPHELPNIIQYWLVLPPIFVLVIMFCFTWVFREDWL